MRTESASKVEGRGLDAGRRGSDGEETGERRRREDWQKDEDSTGIGLVVGHCGYIRLYPANRPPPRTTATIAVHQHPLRRGSPRRFSLLAILRRNQRENHHRHPPTHHRPLSAPPPSPPHPHPPSPLALPPHPTFVSRLTATNRPLAPPSRTPSARPALRYPSASLARLPWHASIRTSIYLSISMHRVSARKPASISLPARIHGHPASLTIHRPSLPYPLHPLCDPYALGLAGMMGSFRARIPNGDPVSRYLAPVRVETSNNAIKYFAALLDVAERRKWEISPKTDTQLYAISINSIISASPFPRNTIITAPHERSLHPYFFPSSLYLLCLRRNKAVTSRVFCVTNESRARVRAQRAPPFPCFSLCPARLNTSFSLSMRERERKGRQSVDFIHKYSRCFIRSDLTILNGPPPYLNVTLSKVLQLPFNGGNLLRKRAAESQREIRERIWKRCFLRGGGGRFLKQ